jgi:Ca-activated chloride channel family protein
MPANTRTLKPLTIHLLPVLGVLVCPAAPFFARVSQAPSTDIRVDVRLVNLNVRVATRTGRAIAGLEKKDFHVFDNGASQSVSHFQPMTAPIHLVLLLDLSGSTLGKMEVIVKAAAGFVDALGPEDDVAVACFDRDFRLLSDFTRDRSLLTNQIRALENKGSSTGFYDAMWSTLDLIDRVETLRKAIVVMSDGFDSSLMDPVKWPAKHGFKELLARAAGGDSVVYPVYLNTESDAMVLRSKRVHAAYVKAFDQVDALARETGGLSFQARRVEDLEGTYRRVAVELRTFYSLAYTPTDATRDGRWHKVEVRVHRPRAVIRTRPGYYAK